MRPDEQSGGGVRGSGGVRRWWWRRGPLMKSAATCSAEGAPASSPAASARWSGHHVAVSRTPPGLSRCDRLEAPGGAARPGPGADGLDEALLVPRSWERDPEDPVWLPAALAGEQWMKSAKARTPGSAGYRSVGPDQAVMVGPSRVDRAKYRPRPLNPSHRRHPSGSWLSLRTLALVPARQKRSVPQTGWWLVGLIRQRAPASAAGAPSQVRGSAGDCVA